MTAAAYLFAPGTMLRLEGTALTWLDRDDPQHALARNRRTRAVIANATGWARAIAAIPAALASLVGE